MPRKSLIELIPSDKGLHSAVLTTFSIDFCFLENLVSKLRGKGVVNIMALADGVMLDGSSGGLRPQENLGKTYTVLGYPTNTIFHPKILLFTGTENAMVIVGSGNLSIHGFGKNVENFNYFFFEGPKDPKVQLLYECWDYLKLKLSQFESDALSQLEAIKKQASWIETSPGKPGSYVDIDESTSVCFIANNTNQGTLKQFANRILSELIGRITIITPFHDRDGATVKQFARHFPEALIRLVLQDNYGQLPLKMDPTGVEIYDFHEVAEQWRNGHMPYFHSKLILFEGPDFTYVYSGSANATNAAMGQLNVPADNEEAGFLWRKPSFDIEEYFGLDFNVRQKKLSDFTIRQDQLNGYSRRAKKCFFIRSAIYVNGELKVNIDPPIRVKEFQVRLYDRELNPLSTWPIAIDKSLFSMEIESSLVSKLCFIAIADDQGMIVSGMQIIQHMAELKKTNPAEGNRLKIKAEEAMAAGMFDDPVILQAIVSLLEGNETNKKKRAQLIRKRIATEKDSQGQDRDHTREEIDEALSNHQQEAANNHQYQKDLLESIASAIADAQRSKLEADHEEEAELNENPNVPTKPNPQGANPVRKSKLIKTRSSLSRIWKVNVHFGKTILDRGSIEEAEFRDELNSILLSFFSFFGYAFNSYAILKEKELMTESLYPEYGALNEHESRYSIFLSLCGTALNVIPFFKTFCSDEDLQRNKIEVFSYILLGICHYWEFDKSKQTDKNKILLEVFMNLKYFMDEEEWKEIDLPSLHGRISNVNFGSILLPTSVLDSMIDYMNMELTKVPNREYLLHDKLGYYSIEEYKPDGDITKAKSYLLNRQGFPYHFDFSFDVLYKRWYNRNDNSFFEGAKKTMSGYDKRVK